MLPSSPIADLRTVALDATWEPALQRFFEANPAYFVATTGRPAQPGDAHDELHEGIPNGWPYTRIFIIGWLNPAREIAAMANIVSDLFATGVWHLGTFIVETARHGGGDAQALYASLERWAAEQGAQWLRLGVVRGNTRAERFWERQGYRQTRLRHGVELGGRSNTLRVMCKPLAGGDMADYLRMVERDRPDPEVPAGRP